MTTLILPDGKEIRNMKDIIEEQKKFHAVFYKDKIDYDVIAVDIASNYFFDVNLK